MALIKRKTLAPVNTDARENAWKLPDSSLIDQLSELYVVLGVEIDPGCIVVSMGSSLLTQMLMLLLLEKGDEVLLPDPTYACYANFVRIAGGVPVPVPITEQDGFQLDPAAVKKRITLRTRALMICSIRPVLAASASRRTRASSDS